MEPVCILAAGAAGPRLFTIHQIDANANNHKPCVHKYTSWYHIKFERKNKIINNFQEPQKKQKDETLFLVYKPWRSGHTSWGGTGSRCGPCSPWRSRGGSRTASAEWPAAPWRSDRSPADDTHRGWPHLPSHTPPWEDRGKTLRGWELYLCALLNVCIWLVLTSRISLLAFGEVFSRNTLMATGIFTFSPSGAHTPWNMGPNQYKDSLKM